MDNRTEEEKESDWTKSIADDCKLESNVLARMEKGIKKELLCCGSKINGKVKIKIGKIKI